MADAPKLLSECEAEIRSCRWRNGMRTKMLWFYWKGKHHGIPFSTTGGTVWDTAGKAHNVWKQTGSSTITNLTLTPSYNCTRADYLLHCHITGGQIVPC